MSWRLHGGYNCHGVLVIQTPMSISGYDPVPVNLRANGSILGTVIGSRLSEGIWVYCPILIFHCSSGPYNPRTELILSFILSYWLDVIIFIYFSRNIHVNYQLFISYSGLRISYNRYSLLNQLYACDLCYFYYPLTEQLAQPRFVSPRQVQDRRWAYDGTESEGMWLFWRRPWTI